MESRILLNAGMKRHKGSLAGLFILMFLAALTLTTALTAWVNAGAYIHGEMNRAGYGDLTAWVSDIPDIGGLQDQITALDEVERVDRQSLIYAEYEAGGQESDSEGQLITYHPEEQRYRFFQDHLTGYQSAPSEIEPGEVYVPPSLVSMMNVDIGDEITFAVARNGVGMNLTVKGYYEDPFMGSSMIGMKGFLISEADRAAILEIIQEAGMNALAVDGAMLHIDTDQSTGVTAADLNRKLNVETELSQYTEFIHSEEAIAGFMLILQNAFGGLLAAFALIMLCIAVLVMGHSIGGAIEQEYVNLGILKTVGFTARKLANIQLTQYLTCAAAGMVSGFLTALPLSKLVSRATLTTTGILVPGGLPLSLCLIFFAVILILLTGFVWLKLQKIGSVTPMKAIRGETEALLWTPGNTSFIKKEGLAACLALRQLLSGKRKYIGACLVAVLLTFFLSLVGRMDNWLGADGKGMMDAFNPADHDIGVQALGQLDSEEVEELVLSYTGITDQYLLAMPDVAVSGVNYTANVISEPERFHIIQGRTSAGADEIVLTESAASDLGVSAGDTLTVRGDKGSEAYTVSGIYQCANDMGSNIGMSREGYLKIGGDDVHLWCHHYFLEDASQKQKITEALETAYGGDVHVHENSWPGLLGIISAMQMLLYLMYGLVLLFILIVTMMTGSKTLITEQKDLGIYKSMGFSSGQLQMTFAMRFSIAAALGSVIGILLAALVTDPLVSSVMKLAGISSFSSAPLMGEILLPAVTVTLLFGFFAYFAAGRIKKVNMTVLVNK